MNNQAKAKFFALNIGQNVQSLESDYIAPLLGVAHIDGVLTVSYNGIGSTEEDIDDWVLLLRSVEDLNDEEYQTIAYLCGYIQPTTEKGKSMIDLFLQDQHLSIMAYDYLRSIGICLPITCLDENNVPVTYDPVEEKWAQIIKK